LRLKFFDRYLKGVFIVSNTAGISTTIELCKDNLIISRTTVLSTTFLTNGIANRKHYVEDGHMARTRTSTLQGAPLVIATRTGKQSRH
jgi:hypothetical protein